MPSETTPDTTAPPIVADPMLSVLERLDGLEARLERIECSIAKNQSAVNQKMDDASEKQIGIIRESINGNTKSNKLGTQYFLYSLSFAIISFGATLLVTSYSKEWQVWLAGFYIVLGIGFSLITPKISAMAWSKNAER
ncbi:MAG: hypothetical protein SA339_11925 [Methanomassiliicoccus sp.]|nr:hypothetical protein [Methanomassiliicoccus sp.]